MPVTLKNGDICLPSHCAFVMKQVTEFDAENCTATIPLTIAMRIKCSGIENREEVMQYLEKNLKCRMNEVEYKINDICFKI